MNIVKLEFKVGKRVGSYVRKLILVKVRFEAAKKVPNLKLKLNAYLVLKKVFKSLEDRNNEWGLEFRLYSF